MALMDDLSSHKRNAALLVLGLPDAEHGGRTAKPGDGAPGGLLDEAESAGAAGGRRLAAGFSRDNLLAGSGVDVLSDTLGGSAASGGCFRQPAGFVGRGAQPAGAAAGGGIGTSPEETFMDEGDPAAPAGALAQQGGERGLRQRGEGAAQAPQASKRRPRPPSGAAEDSGAEKEQKST